MYALYFRSTLIRKLGGFFIRRKLDETSDGKKDVLYRSLLHAVSPQRFQINFYSGVNSQVSEQINRKLYLNVLKPTVKTWQGNYLRFYLKTPPLPLLLVHIHYCSKNLGHTSATCFRFQRELLGVSLWGKTSMHVAVCGRIRAVPNSRLTISWPEKAFSGP